MSVIVDDSKLTPDGLGPTGAMPVEIVQFCHQFTLERLAEITGAKVELRYGDATPTPNGSDPFITDNGNFIADLYYDEPIKDPHALAKLLEECGFGVVDHGIYCFVNNAIWDIRDSLGALTLYTDTNDLHLSQTGLFLDMADTVIIAGEEGITTWEKESNGSIDTPRNTNFSKLSAGYLFPMIAKKRNEFTGDCFLKYIDCLYDAFLLRTHHIVLFFSC